METRQYALLGCIRRPKIVHRPSLLRDLSSALHNVRCIHAPYLPSFGGRLYSTVGPLPLLIGLPPFYSHIGMYERGNKAAVQASSFLVDDR